MIIRDVLPIIVTMGSYNYTHSASCKNDEVLVVINDPGVAQNWENQFNRMWIDRNNFEQIK